MKKMVLSVFLILSLMVGVVPAFAASVDPVNGSAVDVVGNAQATTIVVTIPTALSFAIDPNASNSLVTAPASIVNNTQAPVNVSILGITAATGSPQVYSKDTYTDAGWAALGTSATLSHIALGVKNSLGPVIWALSETPGISPTTPVGSFVMGPKSSDTLTVDAKYGFAWQTAKAISYKLHIRISLVA